MGTPEDPAQDRDALARAQRALLLVEADVVELEEVRVRVRELTEAGDVHALRAERDALAAERDDLVRVLREREAADADVRRYVGELEARLAEAATAPGRGRRSR